MNRTQINQLIDTNFADNSTGAITEEITRDTTKSMLDFAIPYKRYIASLNQSGTDAPTAVVLVNELGGNLVWTKDAYFTGKYLATLTGAFTNKYVKIILPIDSETLQNDNFTVYSAGKSNNNSIYLESANFSAATNTLTPSDDLLVDGYSFIEIQVWDIPA